MKKALIISGGEFDPSVPTNKYDYIFACDKGYEYAMKLGIIPDFAIGDFDSFPQEKISSETSVLSFPIRKDDTDTLLAIKHAAHLGVSSITLLCALGNRLDHTFSNIQAMHYAASHGITIEAISKKEYLRTITPSDGEVHLAARDNYSLSLYALTDIAEEVSINGTSYDCITNLTNSFPLGHGNHFTHDRAVISLKKGVLLLIESLCEFI